MRRALGRFAVFLLAPAALVAAAFLQARDFGIAVALRNATFDAYQRAAPRDYQQAPVRIIDIDDESLARIGQWPWSRIRVSRLIERARAAGAKVLAFDVVFAERDRTAPRVVIPEWTDDPALQARAELLPDPDEVLAYAMRGDDLITGFALTGPGGRIPTVKSGFVVVGDEEKLATLPSFSGAVTTLPDLEAAAAGNGALNFISDKDGVVRSVPIVFRHGGTLVPSLAAEALRLYQGEKTIALQTRAEGETGIAAARIGRFIIPTDAKGQVWIHYSPPVATRTVSAWKLLEPAAPGHEGAFASLEDTIAIVGTSAAGLKDLRFSPLGESIPGVEMHAQLLEQVLGEGPLVRPASAKEWETIGMAVLGTIVVLLVIRFGSIISATVGLAALAVAWMASWQAFVSYHLLFDPLLPSIAIVAAYLTSSVPRQLLIESDRRRVRDAFSRYISPNLVEHLLDNPDALRLGGERRDCSFILTDLADFTKLVERDDPESVVSLLNDYLDGMIEIVFRNEGTLDRIVGDGLVVMFSAPIQQQDHPARAVRCALEMDRFSQTFVDEKIREGVDIGRTRIGVNTGTVIVGNVGGKALFDYRALGDAINTAARLETVNKQLGTRICVAGSTASRCPEFAGRPVGTLLLKGKTQPVEAFEPLPNGAAETPATAAYLEAYRLLEARDPAARQAFAAIAPTDALAAFHLRRLDAGDGGTRIVFTEK